MYTGVHVMQKDVIFFVVAVYTPYATVNTSKRNGSILAVLLFFKGPKLYCVDKV